MRVRGASGASEMLNGQHRLLQDNKSGVEPSQIDVP